MSDITVTRGAVWIAGRWATTVADLEPRAGEDAVRAPITVDGLFRGDRIPRADRVTQLGALVLARAIHGLEPVALDELSVITASTLATAYTNERFERRRLEGKSPEPRAFPYTAPNAAAGEFSIATGARGPTLALVGQHAVSLHALDRACSWIRRGKARRVLVVATECPPVHSILRSPAGLDLVECAAAVVVERAASATARRLRVEWKPADERLAAVSPLLSVHALALVAVTAPGDGWAGHAIASGAGAAVSVTFQ